MYKYFDNIKVSETEEEEEEVKAQKPAKRITVKQPKSEQTFILKKVVRLYKLYLISPMN